MKTNSRSSQKNTFTPLSTMSTEAVCLGVLWSLGAAAVVCLLIYFGSHAAHEVFAPLIEALSPELPKDL